MSVELLPTRPLSATHNPANFAAINVVLVAEKFDLAAINQVWFAKNGVVHEDEFLPGSVFTEAAVVVPTKRFFLLIVPEKLELTLAPQFATSGDPASILAEVLSAFVRALPPPGFKAMGFNFDLAFHPTPPVSFMPWCRDTFAPARLGLLEATLQEDARFGCYFSFNHSIFRVRVDIRPSRLSVLSGANPPADSNNPEVMLASINFHSVKAEPEMILESIKSWQDMSNLVQKIVQNFFI